MKLDAGDVDLFAQASGDRSPLHVDAAYAHLTPFGRPVVHGVLNTLATLGALRPEGALQKLTVDFRNPVFPGETLELEIKDPSPAALRVRNRASAGPALDLKASFVAGARSLGTGPGALPFAEAQSLPSLPLRTRFDYAPDLAALGRLRERFGPAPDPAAAAVLMAGTYTIGMVCPGRQALFSRLVVDFSPVDRVELPLSLEVSASEVDERFGLCTVEIAVSSRGSPVASVQAQAFVRNPPARLATDRVRAPALPNVKTALVIGGSRGLGAALASGLHGAGARCAVTYARTPPSDLPAAVTAVASDASDPASADKLREWVRSDFGALDLLVLNAAPSFQTLPLRASTAPVVMTAIDALLAPLVVPFTGLCEALAPNATVVLISSSFVETAPPQWPHYVAAKAAAEGLLRSAAAADPDKRYLIVRPPRLKTDLTNTPRGWSDALEVETAATQILEQIAQARPGLTTHSWP
jgi:NAD(P)-dependent dehydrogenase (short-subunit alcohol dehydrogenase family)